MYSEKQLYMDWPGLPGATSVEGLDMLVGMLADFLEQAGWSKRMAQSESTVHTEGPMGLGPACIGGDNVFWRVTNTETGECIVVTNNPFEEPEDGPCLSPCGKAPQITGDDSPESTSRGVEMAIKRLFPELSIHRIDGVTFKLLKSTYMNSVTVPLVIGSQLNSTKTIFQHGGFVCTCQPSKKKVLFKDIAGTRIKEYGENNYIAIYFRSKAPSGVPGQFWVSAAKKFGDYPYDGPIAPLDVQKTSNSANDYLRTPSSVITGTMGPADTWRIIGFANPYQLVLHGENSAGVHQGLLCAGALKLMDPRRSLYEDLPITEATWFGVQGNAAGLPNSLRTQGWTNGNPCRFALNDKFIARNITGSPASEMAQLFIYQTRGGGGASLNGLPWDGTVSEACEPWFGFNVNPSTAPAGSKIAPVLGQLWDAMTIYETTPEPNGTGVFPWDGQKWKRYTKNASQTPVYSEYIAHTTCFRVTRTFLGPPLG